MTGRPARSRSSTNRVLARVGLPLLVAVATCAAAVQYPIADVPGGASIGVRGLAAIRPTVLPFRPALSWAPGRRHVVLTFHPEHCRVTVTSVTSTAPGRIEVLTAEGRGRCAGRPAAERFVLPLPLLSDPRRTVRVDVDQQVLRLRWAPAAPHPAGVFDA